MPRSKIRIMEDPLWPIIVLMAITILFAGLLMLRDLQADLPAVMKPPGIMILNFIIFIRELKKIKT